VTLLGPEELGRPWTDEEKARVVSVFETLRMWKLRAQAKEGPLPPRELAELQRLEALHARPAAPPASTTGDHKPDS
jgi:hypothetical protein